MGSGEGPEGGPNGSRNRGNLDSLEIGKVQKPYIFVVFFCKTHQFHGLSINKTGFKWSPAGGPLGPGFAHFAKFGGIADFSEIWWNLVKFGDFGEIW